MRRLSLVILLLCPTVLPADDELPFLKPQVPYSATQVIETGQGTLLQRLWWTPRRSRTETDMGGMSATTITRRDLGLVWVVTSEMGQCIEQTIAEGEEAAGLAGLDSYDEEDVEYRELGEETLDGRRTLVFEAIARDGNGEQRARFWVTPESIPVRVEIGPAGPDAEPDLVVRVTELSLEPPAPDLFEPPGRCIPLPKGMPRMPVMPSGPPGE